MSMELAMQIPKWFRAWSRWAIVGSLLATSFAAETYKGPVPPEPDLPYLLHADHLVPTERAEAREQDSKDQIIYTVPGASSPARTPLAEPIFIFRSENIPAEKLELYRMEVKGGNRQISFPKNPERRMRRGPWPVHLKIQALGEKLYWVEVNQYLDNGEYCLSPAGSTAVFCFQIY